LQINRYNLGAPVIKALIFDLGNVLVHFDWSPAIDQLAVHSKLKPAAIKEILTKGNLAMSYERGVMPTSIFFDQLQESLACPLPRDRLYSIWSNIFTPIEDNIAVVKELQRRYFLGLVSNTNALHVKWIRSQFGFLNFFDRLTFSYDVGVLKPEALIYETAGADFDPSEIWFVDDVEANVTGARQVGWNAVQLQQHQLVREILPEGIR